MHSTTPVFFEGPSAFRRWLRKHASKEAELLVGFYKVGSGRPSLTWPESVDEALCFGWIDGVRKRIDEHSYQIRVTPAGSGPADLCDVPESLGILIMNGMLRFSGSVRREPAIDVWLNEQAAELGAIARKWFGRMRECGDDVRELMHDGYPVACVKDVPFGYVNVFKVHVNVGFFFGAELRDPRGLLEGSGKRMRHVKVKPGEELDSAALSALIDAAYFDVKSRLESE